MPLYIRESEVEELLPASDAVEAVEECFARIARGAVDNRSRFRIKLEGGLQHTMAAADLELGLCGLKTYVGFREGANFVVVLFATDRPEALALIEAEGTLGGALFHAVNNIAAAIAEELTRQELEQDAGNEQDEGEEADASFTDTSAVAAQKKEAKAGGARKRGPA